MVTTQNTVASSQFETVQLSSYGNVLISQLNANVRAKERTVYTVKLSWVLPSEGCSRPQLVLNIRGILGY